MYGTKYLPALIVAPALIGSLAHAQTASIPPYEALVNKYCIACHSEKLKTAGVVLDKRDFADVVKDAGLWERVIRKLNAGEMPPSGLPRPPKQDVAALVSYLETTLDKNAALHPNPGRTLIHRMNRAEYGVAVKDVLGLDYDASELLPPDDSANGFDNIAQMLTISPALLERYLAASAKVSAIAVGDPSAGVTATTYRPRPDLSQDIHIEGTPIGTVGGLVAHHYFPVDGDYEFQPKMSRSILAVVHGLEDPHFAEVSIDDVRVKLVHFGGLAEDIRSHLNAAQTADSVDARLKFRLRVPAGPHTVAVAFERQAPAQTAEVFQQFLRTAYDTNETKGSPHIDKLLIIGPYKTTGPGDTLSRRTIFVCQPADPREELPCARKILATLAAKAYRRPVNENDTETLLSFYQQARNAGGNFDKGIEVAIRRIISGPEFVFRVESDPANVPENTPYRINDLELASRLSFFLWSTIPDDQLIQLGIQKKLHEPQVLRQQVIRMLADPKAEALITNFADQWLFLRNLRGVEPDPELFPDFDDNLRQSMIRETELLFQSIMKEDRPVSDLLTADYTFLNERLARHYGVPGIYGDRYRRVAITDDARKGLLGQGSILTLTSVAIRTSPVTRGKFVLTNLLGTPPPPPPPNVPALKESKTGIVATMRERMTEHRANAFCAGCHKLMDPIGFSMENFDAVGRWRSKDGASPIDAADTLFDGSKINGVVDLRNFLVAKKDVFVQTAAEKLLTYALGRTVDYYDMPAVRSILHSASADSYRFSSIVLGIVNSVPFQMRMKITQPPESTASNGMSKPAEAVVDGTAKAIARAAIQ